MHIFEKIDQKNLISHTWEKFQIFRASGLQHIHKLFGKHWRITEWRLNVIYSKFDSCPVACKCFLLHLREFVMGWKRARERKWERGREREGEGEVCERVREGERIYWRWRKELIISRWHIYISRKGDLSMKFFVRPTCFRRRIKIEYRRKRVSASRDRKSKRERLRIQSHRRTKLRIWNADFSHAFATEWERDGERESRGQRAREKEMRVRARSEIVLLSESEALPGQKGKRSNMPNIKAKEREKEV